MEFFRGLAQARLCFKLDMRRRGLRALSSALSLGSRQHYLNFPWWRSEHMAALCALALEQGIERDYVLWIIRQRRLQPPLGTRDWYWPLNVEILGIPHFSLDSEPAELGSRAEQLIIALAALRGRDHWVERARLIDKLWPDSEGDRAERALDTAVHRLRRQLGSEAMVLTQPGAIALNPGLCRVDYWLLLERLSKPVDDDVQPLVHAAGIMAELPQPVRNMLPMERLQRRIVQSALDLLEASHADAQALRQLEELVEAAPEHERAWQLLIRAYLRQELPSAAVDAWRRCHTTLLDCLGVEPGPATRALVEPWLSPLVPEHG